MQLSVGTVVGHAAARFGQHHGQACMADPLLERRSVVSAADAAPKKLAAKGICLSEPIDAANRQGIYLRGVLVPMAGAP
jgi:hypothetical protein